MTCAIGLRFMILPNLGDARWCPEINVTPYAHTDATLALMRRAPVIPVLTIGSVSKGLALARALVAGGLPVLEITLRTAQALDAIRAMRDEVAGCILGAGTITQPAQIEASVKAGATFLVSPGMGPKLLHPARESPVAFLPGIATASEAMALMEHGFGALKFFPAEAAGGVEYLRSLAGPLGELYFCPTGGIDAAKASLYLAQRNVLCVGGSWMVPNEALQANDFARIELLARAASALRA